jgi:hypothetical protein
MIYVDDSGTVCALTDTPYIRHSVADNTVVVLQLEQGEWYESGRYTLWSSREALEEFLAGT